MPVKIIHPDHVEIIGIGRVLLTSPHASAPEESGIGSMIEESALTSRVYAVIGKVNREFLDPARIATARSELRKTIDSYIAEDGIKYVLDIHGKQESGVEVWAREGQTCSAPTIEIAKARLGENFVVRINDRAEKVDPEQLLTSLPRKEPDGHFEVETVRFDIGLEERQFQREKIISRLSEIADLLNAQPQQLRPD